MKKSLDDQSPLIDGTRRDEIDHALDGIEEQIGILRRNMDANDIRKLRGNFRDIKGWADIGLRNLRWSKEDVVREVSES